MNIHIQVYKGEENKIVIQIKMDMNTQIPTHMNIQINQTPTLTILLKANIAINSNRKGKYNCNDKIK